MSLNNALLWSVIAHLAVILIPASPGKSIESGLLRNQRFDIRLVSKNSATAQNRSILASRNPLQKTATRIASETPETQTSPEIPKAPFAPKVSLQTSEDTEYGLLPAQPVYYPVWDVTRRPQVIQNVDFLTPELLELGVSGSAIVSLYINDIGSIDKVEIEESDLDITARTAVIKEFSKMIFSPASKDKIQVHSKMRIEVILQNTPAQVLDDPNQPALRFW